jgi:hypothetical protein
VQVSLAKELLERNKRGMPVHTVPLPRYDSMDASKSATQRASFI